ncbi:TIGR03745 family integrating conjugative element membrane protein [Klebsiella pneumoniae]|uniref:TIGR03745 family integrating conjugative element membrane protein n=1 Tax=Klebsiella pneumoniae TaxID=573 RepID=UPI00136D1BB1|nr:TIGR03745 family integrating conjugative element membrane protein [Klebsiella pneumoniae]MXM03237.1 TIGR03745 family integrating conjugative element membrane protein [Klebsiella pneumoniae]
MNALFLRARKTVCTALVLGLSSPALADLPTVEGPKSKTDGTFYGKIAGYINDGLVLGGLVGAAVAFIVVAMSCVSTFAEVRDGKATWGKFGAMVAVGVVLIVAVIWLANEAATIVAG